LATVGQGYRTAWSVLCEVSLHLLEPIVNTTLTANTSTGVQTVPVGSTVAMYVGAQLVVDNYNANQEIVTISAIGTGTFTANFAKTHNSGALIITPTFPTQQPTDPFFTQSEMLSYLARSQNEFLAKVPCIFQFFQQNITAGQIYQTTPSHTIEINRIAISNPDVSITSLTRTGNLVTAITGSPHNLGQGSEFSIVSPTNNPLTDLSFLGAFSVKTITNSTTFTYPQYTTNSSSTGGVVGLWTRMYEVSQEELTMADRNWMVENQAVPTKFFEDRTGVYKWGVGSNPVSNFPVELLCAVRDSDTLLLTDGFLLPDMVIHGVKYKSLSYAFSKDGVQKDPSRAAYCDMRFDRIVMATQRWLDGLANATRMPSRRTA